MTNSPTGTITFLFTDIEGSTQLWEQHPEAMQVALAHHDAILRQAIESHQGHIFKTVGDAFYAAFASAPDALLAALDAQRAICAESWGAVTIRVRMGLHSGAVEARNNDYFGPPLNRVARLMSVGHGGQILLSAITRELVQPNLPQNIELRDMGERGLKDLIRPEHIYQVTASGLQADFPPLKTLEAFRTNLPVQLTSFIGREKEIAAVKSLITKQRLVSLTGPGGTGKTRLSLQVAADLLDAFQDGVWFVELAPLSDPALVPQTVLTTIGLREETGRPILEILNNYLQPRKVLLILDNCEHLVQAAAQFAEAILHACLNLRMLVSSREALGIPGEKAYQVASLSTPNPHLPQSVESVAQYEAVLLFVDRAQAVLSGFTITPANAPAVAQICTRLDGIPLAIELAAARVKMLKVEQIAERLDDRFRLLTGGSRTALPRQQTLRAMIDWSYDLLPESERILLRRLSVFAGGWTLEAVETVCQGTGINDYDVLEPLAQLVNKSLIVVDADEATETRYRLLETVRQYAREKLSESGEGLAIRDAHLQYFLGLTERAEPELVGPKAVEWMLRLELELDNIRAALEWSLNRDAQIGLRLGSALFRFWDEYSHAADCRNWLTQLLNHPQAQPHTLVRARALVALGFFMTNNFERQDARAIFEESLALHRELGDKQGIALSLLHLGFVIFQNDNVERGRLMVNESLAIYRELGDKLGIAAVLTRLANNVDSMSNDYERGRAYLDERLAIYREIGSLAGISQSLSERGRLELWQGDYLAARRWLAQALEIQRQLGKTRNMMYTLAHLGKLVSREGDYAQAQTYYEESLSLANQTGQTGVGSGSPTGWILAELGHTSIRQGNAIAAKSFFAQSVEHFKKSGEKIGIVFALEGMASLVLTEKQPERTAQLFAWIETTREILANRRPSIEQADVDRDLAMIRAQLDEASFAAAQAAGRAMSMDEAIRYALESSHTP